MNAPARAPQRFTVDPREVINLYHRCVRCLFVRLRENDTRRVSSTALDAADKFYALAANWMEAAQGARSWQDFGGKRFRVLSQGHRVVSEPISFPDVNIELVFSSRSDAIVELADEGPGISETDARSIFERFVRGASAAVRDGSQQPPVRGSGIGLALVKHIAESHGGRAWVESAAGQGSTFVVTIPPLG